MDTAYYVNVRLGSIECLPQESLKLRLGEAMDIGELLAFGVKNGASDMHLSAGMPMIRVDGDRRKIDIPPMDNTAVRDLVYDIMNDTTKGI